MGTFGENLKDLRIEKGMTQQEVADAIGILDRSTIASWETGRTETSFENVTKLAKLFGVTSGRLLGKEPKLNGMGIIAEVKMPYLTGEENPSLEEYIADFRQAIYKAVDAGRIPVEDAENLIRTNIDYFKFQLEQYKKK